MAVDKKKSHAQRATSSKQSKKSVAAKKTAAKKADKTKETSEKTRMPARVISSLISIALFLVFLIMSLNP